MPGPDAWPFPEYDAGYRLMAQASSSDLTEKLTVAGTCAGRPFTTVYRFDAPGRAWVQEVVRLAERTVGSRGSSPGVAHLGPPPNPEVFQPEAGAPIEVSLTFSQGLGNGRSGRRQTPAPRASRFTNGSDQMSTRTRILRRRSCR